MVVGGITQLSYGFLYIVFLAEYNYCRSFISRFNYNILLILEVLQGCPFCRRKVVSWYLTLQKFDLMVYIISDLFNVSTTTQGLICCRMILTGIELHIKVKWVCRSALCWSLKLVSVLFGTPTYTSFFSKELFHCLFVYFKIRSRKFAVRINCR